MSKGARYKYEADYFTTRERSPTFALELDQVRRALMARRVLEGRILEIGAGSGALAQYCATPSTVWIAADRDLRHFKVTERVPARIQALKCDALALPLKAGTFDAIVAQHVIEHFDHPVYVLRELNRVLREDGVCVLVTPNRRFPRLAWFDDPTHRCLFDALELTEAMVQAGFKKVSIKRLVPWFGSERLVYLSARIQRILSLPLALIGEPSLGLLALGTKTSSGSR